MKKILLIFTFMLAFMSSLSGQTGQIGTGTASNGVLPINSCYGYNYSQQIYTAAEVTGAIGTSTLITKIRFFVSATASPQTNYNQWVVYLGNTAQNDFATTTSWVPAANMTQVYTGTLPTMADGTWVEIPLTTPFTWDGISNLVVAVDENSPSWSCTQNWGSYTAGTNRGMMYRDDNTNPNPATPPTAYTRQSAIPLLQLVAFSPSPCTTTAPTGVTVGNLTSTTATVSWNANLNSTYVVRYRSLPGGAYTTVNIPTLTNNYTIPGLNESTQYEVEVATVCGGVTGAYSTPVAFTTPALSYCTATSTSIADGYISNVTANATNSYVMSNNSTGAFYTNFGLDPTKLITFVRNSTNNKVSVTKTFSGSFQYSFGTGVWIDFNRNGVFETTEQVLNDPSNTTSPVVSAGFTIPAGAYSGTLSTRMRVVLRESASPTACGSFTWGEVEDYDVKFVDLQPCTTAPPTNISVANITPTSATVSWVATSGATYIIRYRTGTGAWTTVTLPTTTPPTSIYNILGLAESTPYEVQVATICGGTTGAFSPSTTFTTPAITYCTSGPTSTTLYEYISNVTVTPTGYAPMVSASLTPLPVAPFYSDYTNDPARLVTLIRGTSNNSISATKTWPNFQYAAGTRAWIDFNRNGIFGDNPNELVLDSPSNTTSIVNNPNFSVPTVAQGAYAGNLNVRMRVIILEGGVPSPCGGFTWGEVEDYSVRLIDLLPCTTAAPSNITVANMTATTAYVSWLPAAGATYQVRWRQIGQTLWQQQPAGFVTIPAGQSFYTITGLTEQTNYEVQVKTICNGTAGAFGPSVNFTTPPLTYCPMVGTGTNDYISNVKVTPVNFPVMDNTSLQTNYISYTTPATLINLEVGSTGNQLSVSKAWQTTTYADAVDAYIDYNRDGIFAANEKIMTSASSTTTPVTVTFNVPPAGPAIYAGPLTTTLRVILKRSSGSVMCVDPVNGEVEDYAVKLRPCSNVTPTNVTVTPITQNSATVNWTSVPTNIAFVLEYRAVTNPVSPWITVNASTLTGNPPVQLTGLTPATTYEVRIAAKCATGGLGAYTPVKLFTTRCDPTPPNVTVTNITSTSAVVTWNPIVPSATYLIRYRPVGSTTWISVVAPAPPANSVTLTGLSSYVTYEVQVANQCVGETTPNPWSNPQVFTTIRICEIPPPGLTITTLTPTSAEVVWDAFTGAGATGSYVLRYRKVGIPSWTTINVNTNTYTITGLLELTKYEMQVANICSGTPGNFTPPYYFTTPTIVYCQMSSNNSATEYISKVTVKPTGKPEMINITTASNYSDYTTVQDKYIEMVQGSNGNSITIDKTLTNSASAGVAVWIDFNRNGYFDINERILVDGINTNPTASGTFSVPADAFVSMTDYKYVRMRVAMQKDGIPVNCANFDNGEVEDYTVRISKQGVANTVNQTDILIYPNPVTTVLNVKNISKKANYKIYSAAGQLVSSGLILNNKIDVSRLINGLYVIDIEDVKGTVQKKFIKE
ncbi:fibronectin type III domain-containing protein [Chryseobacterium wangxinyae]|uniref:fibronectin type III domain-containing protein n=1 Tax=Chryseobacterium sp. CY353 TaxID=2997334 RepID=UPI00226DF6C5|nr:fibronectin type III domain-containing protein [Chryseobacterium sp. CY353]MCY0970295.1 fibronectin type III domain-containing protein [Chryseobacterium sp. CY353]